MDVRVQGHFTLRSPLSHIGETISTTAYLVQEPILQSDGSIEEVFVYGGNAWRGQLRDLAATYLLTRLGTPTISVDAFHLLYAGGRIGGEQTVNIEQARAYRRALPILSLWGGGVGNQIMPGKLRVGSCYPVCREATPVMRHTVVDETTVSYRQLTTERSHSRTDNSKDDRLNMAIMPTPAASAEQIPLLSDGDAPKGATTQRAKRERAEGPEQMRMTVEVVIAGARLETRIDLLAVSEVELGCLVSALHQFARSPHIGGLSGKGYGAVDLTYDLVDLATGETMDFVTVADGRPHLAPAAANAKTAYDDHLHALYDAFLDAGRGEIRQMLGAT